MSTLYSFPATLPLAKSAKTRQVKVTADNTMLLLEEGTRSFSDGDVVDLSDYEFNLISASAISSGLIVDQGDAVDLDANTTEVSFEVTLANIAAGTVSTFVPDVAGDIVSWYVTVTDAASTAAAATLTLEIDGVAVTGATLAATNSNLDTAGEVVAGGTITGANTFAAAEEITLEAASVTDFSEGAVVVTLVLEDA